MWLEVLYWIDHVWSSIECVCSACGPSQRLDAPSIYVLGAVVAVTVMHVLLFVLHVYMLRDC